MDSSEAWAIVGLISRLRLDGASLHAYHHATRRSHFAVLCGQYGDVTRMAQLREQSRQSLYREWLSIHCRACGGVGDDRERSLSLSVPFAPREPYRHPYQATTFSPQRRGKRRSSLTGKKT